MIEGMPASNSVTVPRMLAIFRPLKYSPVNNATGNENGTHMTSAKKVVSNVPVMNGSAP